MTVWGRPLWSASFFGGRRGARTPDSRLVRAVLYQLSYSPAVLHVLSRSDVTLATVVVRRHYATLADIIRAKFMRDIVLPEAKPALEWVNGRVLQKESPQRKHAVAQGRFWGALDAWARERGSGMVGTEWEFRI